jgi:flagellar motor switch protein FliM
MESSDVLTEQELDALMDSISENGVEGDAGAARRDCELFDFASRQHMLLAQMPALETLTERHAGALAQMLMDAYKMPVKVVPAKVAMLPASQALQGITEPAGINLFSLAPLNGLSCVVLPGDFLSFLVESYFGGAPGASSGRAAGKELTPTERRINDVFCGRFLDCLQDVWKDKVALTPSVQGVEQSPEHMRIGSEDDLILRFSFAVTAMECEFSIDWCMPYATLEPLRARLGVLPPEVQPQASADWERHFRSALESVSLEITGAFFTRTVSIADVLTYKEGFIVPIQMPDEVTVLIEGVPFSMGEHGVINGKKSIKIKELVQQGSNVA